MAKRKIIQIDEEKCDGCGQCVPSCAEGAIKIIQGKARLVSETYCDGLGACLAKCPQDAITIIEREAFDFDEAAVKRHLATRPRLESAAFSAPIFAASAPRSGCPGSAMRSLSPLRPAADPLARESSPVSSQLRNWPVQLHLAPVRAAYYHEARLLLAADCAPFAFPDFHRRLLAGKILLIACPKLDNTAVYREKLQQIFTANELLGIDIAYMEVPCCGGLIHLVRDALQAADRQYPVNLIRLGIRGEILSEQPLKTADLPG